MFLKYNDDKVLKKGKEIVQDDANNLHTPAKENLVDMAGPSNSKVIVETIIDPKDFLGVNNDPVDDLEARKSPSLILGFVSDKSNSENNVDQGIETSNCNSGNSPIKGVIEVQDKGGDSRKDLQSPSQRIEVCSNDTIVADSQSASDANHGSANVDNTLGIMVRRSATIVSPINSIKNQIVAADTCIISPLWSQEEDDFEEDIQPISVANPSKYLVEVPVELQEDPNTGYTTILSKSMKKRNRQKAAKAAQAERNISCLRDGPKHYG